MKHIIILLMTCFAFGQGEIIFGDTMRFASDDDVFIISQDDTTYDTIKVLLIEPINIELLSPQHHWEERYYGVGKVYTDYNLLSFAVKYLETRTVCPSSGIYFRDDRSITEKYYNMDWTEYKPEEIIMQMSCEDFKPDTIRYEK